jgi:hypothetical protein
MNGRLFATALAATFVFGSLAHADDNLRLLLTGSPSNGFSGGASTMTLQLDDSNTAFNEDVGGRFWGGGRGWGGHGWGGRGWGWGGRGWNTGWGWGGRGWGWGGRGWGWGGWGWGWGGRPFVFAQPSASFYVVPSSSWYFAPPVWYPSVDCSPIAMSGGFIPNTSNAALPQYQPLPSQYQPMPPANGSSNFGTYPYNGGPVNPVPMPLAPASSRPMESQPAPKTLPLEGLPISLPGTTAVSKKYTYPAYGEPARTAFAEDRITVIKK